MPQDSVYYAAGRIAMLRRDAMDASRLERLLSTSSFEEAKRTLSEIGWTSAETADYEQLALDRVAQASELVQALTTDAKVTDCFLLKYDIANLKMLLKARCLGIPADYLSKSGTMKAEDLRHAVADHRYDMLPAPIAAAMEELETDLLVEENPLTIDVKLDRAMFTQIFQQLKGTRSKTAVTYFTSRVDMLNAMTLLRARQMRRDVDFFVSVLLPGGAIQEGEWRELFEAPETLPTRLAVYGTGVKEAASQAVKDFKRLPSLERAADNALLALFDSYHFDCMRLETVVCYLLAVEREASAVRLVMAGKQSGFAMDAIQERLRDLYA